MHASSLVSGCEANCEKINSQLQQYFILRNKLHFIYNTEQSKATLNKGYLICSNYTLR